MRYRTLYISLIFLPIIVCGSVDAGELKLGLPFPVYTREWELAEQLVEDTIYDTDDRLRISLTSPKKSGPTQTMKIADGALDGGFVPVHGFGPLGLDPSAYLYGLPFLFATADEMRDGRNQLDKEILRLASQGPYEALAFLDMGFAYVMSARDLSDPNNWATCRFWRPQKKERPIHLDLIIDVLGWKAVSVPGKAVKQGLQSGTIDTVIAPPTVAVFKRWHTGVQNVFMIPLFYNYSILIVRDDAMSRLSPSERKMLRERLTLLGENISDAIRKRDQRAWKVLDRNEIKMTTPDAAMKRQWRQWSDAIWRELDDTFKPSKEIWSQRIQSLRDQ